MPEAERRRKLLLELIASEPVSTQSQLVRLLHQAGIACTQASVSRDINDLGLVKLAGRYSLPPTAATPLGLNGEMLHRVRSVQTAGDALLIVHTNPGEASLVALAIDNQRWPSVAGTVAGDDTLFIACPGRIEQQKTLRRLRIALAVHEPPEATKG